MTLEKKRWIILIASCFINLCIGSLYAWSVFASPMAVHINEIHGLTGTVAVTAANLAIVFTVANLVGPVTMISGGFINDTLGPRWVILVGAVLFGGGFILSGFSGSIPFLVVSYGLGCGLGMGMIYGATVNNSVKFFPDKRGLIGGIATATYGFSSVLIPPVAHRMIGGYGILTTFRVLGILFFIIIVGCAFLIEKAPADFIPESMKGMQVKTGVVATDSKTWREMMANGRFYIMFLMLMCGAFSGLMIISQASPMAQKMIGMTAQEAALAVSVLALFNAFGRIMAGYISDKFGRVQVIRVVFLVSVAGLACLFMSGQGQNILFILGISLAGICFGAFMGIFPGFTADSFGPKYNSVNYGIMFIAFALAGTVGPLAAGKIVMRTGNYQMAFAVAGILAVLGFILTFIYRKMANNG